MAEGIWLGPLVSEEFLASEPAASPAANQWQANLLRALGDAGHPMAAIGGVPRAAWPAGPLIAEAPNDERKILPFQAELTGYLNLPVIKWLSLHTRLRARLTERFQRKLPVVLFTYNAGCPETMTALWARRRFGIPWICVVADYPEASDRRVSALRRGALDRYGDWQRRKIGEADGRVYLSWYLAEQDGSARNYFLEGGVSRVNSRDPASALSPRVVMFAGTLREFSGIELLLTAFREVRCSDCELWICGRGNLEDRVIAAAAGDSRIRFYGLVSRDRLLELMSAADIFVNPRPSALPENRANFPSKLLEYFQWGRPVISTMTPGIPPHYRQLLETVEPESAGELARVLDETIALSDEQLIERGEVIRRFVEDNLLWRNQAIRFWEWVEEAILLRAGRSLSR